MSKVTLIQCSNVPTEHPELPNGLYPTGVWLDTTSDWIKENFKEDVAIQIIHSGALNLTTDMWIKLGLPSLTLPPVTIAKHEILLTNLVV